MQFKSSPLGFIIYLPQTTEDTITFSDGTVLYLDTSYNPKENRVFKGEVVATPSRFDLPVQKGDYLYFHHNIINKNSQFKIDDNHYLVPADPRDPLCYAYERDGKIDMLFDYTFILPIIDEEDKQYKGIILPGQIISKKKGEITDGYLKYANRHSLSRLDAKIGDKVNWRKLRNAKFKVNGEELFRVRDSDINFIYNEQEV